jgi:hypothetical protein
MFDDGPEAVNQHTKTHVIIQNAENSSKISFSTHRSYCHATYFGEQGTSHSKVILPTAESTAQGEDSSDWCPPRVEIALPDGATPITVGWEFKRLKLNF